MFGLLLILISFGIAGYLLYDEYKARFRYGKRQKRERPEWMGYPWTIYIPAILGFLLALIYRTWLISPFFLIIGVAISWYMSRRLYIAARLKMDRQVLDLAVAFRGIYKVRPAVFATLEEARKKLDDPLGGHIAATVQAFYVTSSPQKAYAELARRVKNPYLDQFVFILERSETASREVVYQALDNLIQRLRRHEDLRSKSEINLAAITGQTRFIQALSLIIIFAIGLTGVRGFYVDAINSELLFILVVSVALLTSWYIDWRTESIKEKVL